MGKALEEGRGESRGCTAAAAAAAAPADEVAALSATLDSPEYTPGRGEDRKG